MSSSIDKAKIPIAASKINRFDLPQTHITTTSFMRFQIACCRNLVKKTTLKDNHDTFIRTSPLEKPFYGNCFVHDRAFFVPYRVVWEPFEDFRNNVPHNQSSGTQINNFVPSLTEEDFVKALADSYFASIVTDSAEIAAGHYDFTDDGGVTYYKLNSFGRAALALMEQLGYKLFNYSGNKSVKFSALPLLCAAKVYLDWYFPSAYAHYGLTASLDGYFQRQFYYELTWQEIAKILRTILFVSYDSDFYTSLYENPVGPNDSAGSINFQILDVTSSSGSEVKQDTNGTPVLDVRSGSVFSQYTDKALKALSSYVARHRMSGSRSLDRALASYGVLLSAEKLKRCYYLGSNEYPLHVADVMSTAETSEASLGSYAGKAVASSSKVFDMYTDEDGMFFVINSVVPKALYYQGIDANVEARSILDFHTPEFDNLGPVAVKASNLYISQDSVVAINEAVNGTFLNQLFGFAPRYYHLKIPYDRITGDFARRTVNSDIKSWFMARELYPDTTNSTTLAAFKHNLDFVLGLDSEQYKNVFLTRVSDEDVTDVFYMIHRDHITLEAPMRPLYDSFEFEDEDDKPKVTTEPNGVKVN